MSQAPQPITQLLVVGPQGRMGQAILRLVAQNPALEIAGTVGRGDAIADRIGACEVVLDVSHHSQTEVLTQTAVTHRKALVIGTTGHSAAAKECLSAAARQIPVLLAPNFAVGVNVLFYLTRKAAEILGSDYDQEILEMHHRLKSDAPSGTAKRLAEVLCEVKGKSYQELVRNGREGEPGPRTRDEIGVHAIRGGDVAGDHTVIFAGTGERVELTYKASSRDTFAAGALRAALWIRNQPPGFYSMEDVLGLKG